MTPTILFIIIIGILILNYIVDQVLGHLNAKHYRDPVPEPLNDVYDEDKYLTAQRYNVENHRFELLSSGISLVMTLAFFFIDGFAIVDRWARNFSDDNIVIALIFFGIIMFASSLLSTPFAYYHTFVIEEKYGFNKTTRPTFVLDKIKGWLLTGIIGGILLAAIVWFYETVGKDFWLYAWAVVTVFTIFMNLFYSRLIVPLFNKQSPLKAGTLKDKIEQYARKVGFRLDKIYVIDGSKRSTKANAYFSGFGREKRVTLYDTLINDLQEEEIVAVLAHEVGHYKRNHIIFNLFTSILITGFTLWVLSLFIDNPVLSSSLNVSEPSFHIGLIAFGILYSPITEFTGLIMNYVSRKFEYQADDYASNTYKPDFLISGLKKLSGKNLSNLTPHPYFVFVHYSHPTLFQRIKNLMNE